ncbi:uncharacterized protein LOC109545743 [Dendroctonus ponderosae]|uniref:uncharacterized protein LOC109545743 n=1 Tax=Dendroctonus ponderosae TaxID=77166 RepID=UPI002035A7E4|nr:uncharacterized protein LOC109545743 [Dendroctonus ponderosae]
MTDVQNGLPPGWDCKFDENSGKFYYIHHYSRITTWEDPRIRHRGAQAPLKQCQSIAVEHIPLQHRSPDLRRNSVVHPSHSPPIQAFLLNSRHFQEPKPAARSPFTLRSAKVPDHPSTNERYDSNGTSVDDPVAKISAMFPTVSETHIKLLLNKYLNREALVISALQVEKHPITTPGPFSTPPPQRNLQNTVKEALSRTGSPRFGAYRSSPNPHSSPKLKLRYMKSIFPNADETLILECLQNNENSIQKTSETLNEKGYSKRDTVKLATPKPDPKLGQADKVKTPSPLKTGEEKQELKDKLKAKYQDVPEHLISIALESVHFNECRANQILDIMKQEDNEVASGRNGKHPAGTSAVTSPQTFPVVNCNIPITQSRQSIKSLLKSEKSDNANRFSRNIDENNAGYKSALLSNTQGHNSNHAKGQNQKLLLENYVQWQGPNKTLAKGPQALSRGANRALLSTKLYTPCGPNAEYRKGFRLAKGSIFAQIKAVVVGDSNLD